MVFGKWRGTPGGKITLQGVSGEGEYSAVVEPGKVKPSNDNSALRYLWARHRISVLSDYNSLRSDAQRIKEVTNLGLKYNLLTAYTSFVATDSEVRNAGGSQSSVKQPLPLPKGVSDYAVGAPAKIKYAAAGYGGPAGPLKELRYSESVRKSISASIFKIAVSDESFKEGVEKEIRRHLNEVQRCYTKGHGKVVFTFMIDTDGSVTTVNIGTDETGDSNGTDKLILEMKKWPFPKPAGGGKVKVTVSLIIG